MFWPPDEMLRAAGWWREPLGHVTWGTLVSELRPLLRAHLMAGWSITGVSARVGSGDWSSLELASLDLVARPSGWSPERAEAGPSATANEIQVVLDADPILDLLGGQTDPAGAGSEVGSVTPEPNSYAIDGAERPQLFVAPGSSVDSAVTELLDAETGPTGMVGMIAATATQSTAPMQQQPNQGMLWMFNPRYWGNFNDPSEVPGLLAEMLPSELNLTATLRGRLLLVGDNGRFQARSSEIDFVRSQLFNDRRLYIDTRGNGPADLAFVMELGNYPLGIGEFLPDVFHGLRIRGEATRLLTPERTRLRRLVKKVPWFDLVCELIRVGAIEAPGVWDPGPNHRQPLAVEHRSDGSVVLTAWHGEGQITITRESTNAYENHGDDLGDGVTWEYLPGGPYAPPTVLIVAGRGVKIECSKYLLDPTMPKNWQVEIIRVQSDSLVPPRGVAVDTTALLASTLLPLDGDEGLNDSPSVWVKPKPDGVFLQFPVFEGAEPSLGYVGDDLTIVPCVVELTVDTTSGIDGFTFDVHYTRDTEGRAAAHLVVWATDGVSITSTESDEGDTPSSPRLSAPATFNRAVGDQEADAWAASVEFWRTDLEFLPRPREERLPALPSATSNLADLQVRLGATIPVSIGASSYLLPTSSNAGGEYEWGGWTLVPASHVYGEYSLARSLGMVAAELALAIGFPGIADGLDIIEAFYACVTGYDKWGRPVSNMQLGLMIIGAGLPIVTSGFVSRVAALAGAGRRLESPRLGRLFREARHVEVGEARRLAIAAMDETYTRARRPWSLTSKERAANELLDFIFDNPNLVDSIAARVIAGGGTYLRPADIAKGDGCALPSIDMALRRYRRLDGVADDLPLADFLALDVHRGHVALLKQAIIEGAADAARPIARAGNFPLEEARPNLAGSIRSVDSISTSELRNSVESIAASHADEMLVGYAGTAVRASDASGLTPAEVAEVADGLLARSVAREGSATDGLAALAGKDQLNHLDVSLEERAFRVARAIHALHADMISVGLDPRRMLLNRLPDGSIVRSPMEDVAIDYIRMSCTRKGYAHALRSEARVAGLLEHVVRRHPNVVGIRHGVKLPNIGAATWAEGSDGLVYLQVGDHVFAVIFEYKAYKDPFTLFGGGLTFKRSGGVVTRVKGPALTKQAASGTLRYQEMGYLVPPPGAAWPTGGTYVAAADAVPVATVQVHIVDDIYMTNALFNALGSLIPRNATVIDLTTMAQTVEVRTLRRVLGNDPIDVSDAQALHGRIFDDLTTHLGRQEDISNAALSSADTVAALNGRGASTLVRPATWPMENIIDDLVDLLEVPTP